MQRPEPRAIDRTKRFLSGRAAALGLLGLVAACNDTRDLAPAAPDVPWQADVSDATPVGLPPPPSAAPAVGAGRSAGDAAGTTVLPRRFELPRVPSLDQPSEPSAIDPAHVYTLPELIDVAERRNHATRLAWELARQAATAVGVAQAALLPTVTLQALAGYERTASPFPNQLIGKGYITAQAQQVLPSVAVKYLLLDFGSREATVASARDLSWAADVEFTAAHQTLILAVTRTYLTLDGVDAARRAAEQSLASALVLQDAAEQRYAHEVGTVVEVALARRGTAQARVAIADVVTAQHAARLSLLSAMELPPDTVLHVADSSRQALAVDTGATVDRLIHDALQRRPELLADLARLRAADEGVALARSAMLPKLAVTANVEGNLSRISVNNGPYESVEQPQAGVFLAFAWPIYAGGLFRNELHAAESRRAAAVDVLQQEKQEAMRQVALAYDAVGDSLSRYDANVALDAAARTAFEAASSAYRNGLGSLTDAAQAQTALATAQASMAQAHAQALINAAALAFSVGALSSSEAAGMPAMPPVQTTVVMP